MANEFLLKETGEKILLENGTDAVVLEDPSDPPPNRTAFQVVFRPRRR